MSKIGEIYQIKEVAPVRYFQLVAFDITQLNSDVIAVFSYKGGMPDKISAQDISKITDSGVDFFAHTMVNIGIAQKQWAKIGKANSVDTSKALFKDAYHDGGVPNKDTYGKGDHDKWVIWKIGEEWVHIGPHINEYPQAELGSVFAPVNMVYRIKHGRYQTPYYNQER